MTEEEIKKMHEITNKYSRKHMFKMMSERKNIIEKGMASIVAGELETEAFIAQEKLKKLIGEYVDNEKVDEMSFSL